MFLNFKKVKVIVILFAFNFLYSGDFKQIEFNGYEFDLESQKLLEDFNQATFLANYPCTHHCDEYKQEMFQKLYDGLSRNYAPAINFLGVLSENGWHTESCLDCAYNYFSLAAMHGDKYAKQNLRRFQQQYFPDLSLAQVRKIFKEKSREYIRSDEGKEYIKSLVKLANKDINAAYQLGNYFSLDEEAVLALGIKEKQIVKALKYASDNGHMHAKYLLGKYLYNQQKFNEAYNYFNSITPGTFLYSRALNILGWMHYNGQGVEVDFNKSLTYFLRSVSEGYKKAQYGVGLASIGRGNIDSGINSLQLAAQMGNASAFRVLGDIYKNRNELDRSFKAYKSAADLGDVFASFEVGYYYQVGQVVEKDFEQSLKYYEIAEKSNKIAAYNAELSRITLRIKKTLKDLLNITKEIDTKVESNISSYLLISLDTFLRDSFEIPEEDYVEAFLYVIQKVNFEENKVLIKCIFKSFLAKLNENNLEKVINTLNQKNFFKDLNLEDYSLEEIKKISKVQPNANIQLARYLFEKGDFSFAIGLFEDAVQRNDLDVAIDIFVKSKFNMFEIKLIISSNLKELSKSNDQRASYLYANYLMHNAEKGNEWSAVDACQILNRLARQNYRNSFALVVQLSSKFKDLIPNEELLDLANFVLTQDEQKECHEIAKKIVDRLNRSKEVKKVETVVKVEATKKAEKLKLEKPAIRARGLFNEGNYKEAYFAFKESVQQGAINDIWYMVLLNRLENLNDLSSDEIELYCIKSLNIQDSDLRKITNNWKEVGLYKKLEELAENNDFISCYYLTVINFNDDVHQGYNYLEKLVNSNTVAGLYIFLSYSDQMLTNESLLIHYILHRAMTAINQENILSGIGRQLLNALLPKIDDITTRFEIAKILMQNKNTQEEGIVYFNATNLIELDNSTIAKATGAFDILQKLAEQENKTACVVLASAITRSTYNKIQCLYGQEQMSEETRIKFLNEINKDEIINSYNEALSLLKKAQRLKGKSDVEFSNEYLAQANYYLGTFYQIIGREKEANLHLEVAYNNGPATAKELIKSLLGSIKYNLAIELINESSEKKQKNLEKAVELLKKSAELGYISAYKSLGALLLEMHLDSNVTKKGKKLLKDAEVYLNKALEFNPDDDTIRMDLAIVAYLNNDEAKGLKILRESRSPLRMISSHLLNLGDRIFNGLSDIDRFLTLKGKDAFTLGSIYIRCAADLGNTKAQMVAGKLYYQSRDFYRIGYEGDKDWNLSEKYFKMAIENEHDGIEEEYCMLANIYANTGRQKEAIEFYSKAEKRGYGKAAQEKGMLYYHLGLYKNSAESLENALRLDPKLFSAQGCLSLLHLNGFGVEKNIQKAVSYLIKAIRNGAIVNGNVMYPLIEKTIKVTIEYLKVTEEKQLLNILNTVLKQHGYEK